MHPQLAHERSGELPLFEALLPSTRYIGEIGLDGSPGFGQHAVIQQTVFERTLELSKEHGGKILTIHSRRAVDEVLALLSRNEGCGAPVLHWFTGTIRQLQTAVAQGCWFSVGPPMLRSAKGRQLVQAIPRDRLLTETDGPFARIGPRQLEPIDAHLAVQGLAALWGEPLEDTKRQLRSNLRTLVGLVPDLR